MAHANQMPPPPPIPQPRTSFRPFHLDRHPWIPHPSQVLTGHIGFGPSRLARLSTPFTALTFLREPVARLVSLFNMYPPGTWASSISRNRTRQKKTHPPGGTHQPRLLTGSPPAVAEFAGVYFTSLAGRSALTCFVSGDAPCDSVGAPGTLFLREFVFRTANAYQASTPFACEKRKGWLSFFSLNAWSSKEHVTIFVGYIRAGDF
jgi:hypothetical protein